MLQGGNSDIATKPVSFSGAAASLQSNVDFPVKLQDKVRSRITNLSRGLPLLLQANCTTSTTVCAGPQQQIAEPGLAVIVHILHWVSRNLAATAVKQFACCL